VIDSLCDQAREDDIAVACFYCDFQIQQDQTLTRMMGAILKGLIARGSIPDFLRDAYQKKFVGRGLLLPDLMKLLKEALASLPQVFICIDALDEFPSKDLPVLLKSLKEIVQEFPSTRIFLTGRPTVRKGIEDCFPEAIVIPVSPHKDDIKSYLEKRLDDDHQPGVMNSNLRAEILKTFQDKMWDM